MNENGNKIIQGLWVNGTLMRLQLMSIQSFINCGHEFHLYTYNSSINAPKGTVIKPAGEIIDEKEVFLDERDSLTAFADLFRYELLYQKGGWWVDLDVVCLRPFDFSEEYVFSSIYEEIGKKTLQIGVMKTPIHSAIMKSCVNKARQLLGENDSVQWALLGKDILIDSCNEHLDQQQHYVYDPNVFSPIPWYFFNLLYSDIAFTFPDEVYAVHFYHEMLRLNSIDSDLPFPENSYFERIYAQVMSATETDYDL